MFNVPYRLTGKFRYSTRKRLLRPDRVVVEVEIEWGDGPDDHNGMPTYLEGSAWKEASPADMLRLTQEHTDG